ncbi:general stress protein [Spongiactinospora sp. TRM90649]|uniref:general stress protein n=1 Tax=Spongiactinospora sp. TRM90649 TaxID=3031114 RepID=UPI0023F8D1B9|nr:general stress protein [Spongiactinospora sp. TRM90649]MDF5759251.1 hypothetical protein [Spongiactinospora sp. TRM90649]
MSTVPSVAITANHEPIGEYATYEEAQRVVDYLSDHEFPVEGTLIIGVGLRTVERVVARLTYWRALAMGAAGGAWFGLLIGLFFGLFASGARSWLALLIWGLIWGAIAGAIFGLVSHALTGGRRDFVSSSSLVADRYQVLVESGHAARAHDLLVRSGERHL